MLAVALAEIYAALTPFAGGIGWVAALCVHSLLAAFVLGRRGRGRFFGGALLYYAPSAVVALGSFALVAVGSLRGGATSRSVGPEQLAWILIVPWVEEAVFRLGIGDAFRRYGGVFWGTWFSAVVFGLVHTQPTVASLVALRIGLPLGPFLLALCCEAIYVRSGRLLPAVAFHAACNATVVIFAYGDARWLDWLGLLYS